MSCFQGLLFCPEAASLLLHNFCIYHISPPGHEVSRTCCYSECLFFRLSWHDASGNSGRIFFMIAWFTILREIMQLGAAPILPSSPVASVDDLADQVADVLDFFG